MGDPSSFSKKFYPVLRRLGEDQAKARTSHLIDTWKTGQLVKGGDGAAQPVGAVVSYSSLAREDCEAQLILGLPEPELLDVWKVTERIHIKVDRALGDLAVNIYRWHAIGLSRYLCET